MANLTMVVLVINNNQNYPAGKYHHTLLGEYSHIPTYLKLAHPRSMRNLINDENEKPHLCISKLEARKAAQNE